MTEAEGHELIQKCIHELQTRFVMSQRAFMVKIVTADGVREISL
jgi:hypothetical protein